MSSKYFKLIYTQHEWELLFQAANGDDKIHKWVNTRLHDMCACEQIQNSVPAQMILKEQRGFSIPNELVETINQLSIKYNTRPATIIKRFITDPHILIMSGIKPVKGFNLR